MTTRLIKSLLALSFVGAMAVSFPSAGSASGAIPGNDATLLKSLSAQPSTLPHYGWGDDGDGGYGGDGGWGGEWRPYWGM